MCLVGVSEIDREEESVTCRDTEESKKKRKQNRVQKPHNESTHTHTHTKKTRCPGRASEKDSKRQRGRERENTEERRKRGVFEKVKNTVSNFETEKIYIFFFFDIRWHTSKSTREKASE